MLQSGLCVVLTGPAAPCPWVPRLSAVGSCSRRPLHSPVTNVTSSECHPRCTGSWCGQAVCGLPPQEQGLSVNQRLTLATHPQGIGSCVPRTATKAHKSKAFGLRWGFLYLKVPKGVGQAVCFPVGDALISFRPFPPPTHLPPLRPQTRACPLCSLSSLLISKR